MSARQFILKEKIHFNSIRTAISKGTIISVDDEKNTFEIGGNVYDGLSDVNICIKAGYIIPYVDGTTKVSITDRLSPKAQERIDKGKMEVIKSDLDDMDKEIDITATKTSVIKEQRAEERKSRNMEVIREDSDKKEARGLAVVDNDAKRLKMKVTNIDADSEIISKIDGDDSAKLVPTAPEAKTPSESHSPADGRVVKSIGIGKGKTDTKGVSSARKLSAKHSGDSSKTASDNAERRKKELASRKGK